jgi:hypothetical protein
MTDEQIRAEIARQIDEKLARLATNLRLTGKNHGPVVEKALSLTAAEIEKLL